MANRSSETIAKDVQRELYERDRRIEDLERRLRDASKGFGTVLLVGGPCHGEQRPMDVAPYPPMRDFSVLLPNVRPYATNASFSDLGSAYSAVRVAHYRLERFAGPEDQYRWVGYYKGTT